MLPAIGRQGQNPEAELLEQSLEIKVRELSTTFVLPIHPVLVFLAGLG